MSIRMENDISADRMELRGVQQEVIKNKGTSIFFDHRKHADLIEELCFLDTMFWLHEKQWSDQKWRGLRIKGLYL
jgi:hypothetical protein